MEHSTIANIFSFMMPILVCGSIGYCACKDVYRSEYKKFTLFFWEMFSFWFIFTILMIILLKNIMI